MEQNCRIMKSVKPLGIRGVRKMVKNTLLILFSALIAFVLNTSFALANQEFEPSIDVEVDNKEEEFVNFCSFNFSASLIQVKIENEENVTISKSITNYASESNQKSSKNAQTNDSPLPLIIISIAIVVGTITSSYYLMKRLRK